VTTAESTWRKTIVSPARALAAAALAAAALGGCAESRDSLRKQIADLEREVLRLKAEAANAVAKGTALDDERIVLEKKVAACAEQKRERSLKVVRLEPGEEGAPPEAAAAAPAPRDDGKRPVLTLVGARSWDGGSGAAAPAPLPQSPSGVPSAYRGDNLGVVAGGAGGPAPAAASSDGSMDQFHEAYRAFTDGRYEEALAGFSRFVAAQPESEYADNALFWRGECLLAEGKQLQAVGEYERLLRRYPRSEKAPTALLRIGFIYDRLNDFEKASDYYFKVVDGYPGSDEARKASQRVAAIQEARSRAFGVTPTSAER